MERIYFASIYFSKAEQVCALLASSPSPSYFWLEEKLIICFSLDVFVL